MIETPGVFPSDRPEWSTWNLGQKRVELTREWLTPYAGDADCVDPLSRWSAAKWEAASDEVGYFSILLKYRQLPDNADPTLLREGGGLPFVPGSCVSVQCLRTPDRSIDAYA